MYQNSRYGNFTFTIPNLTPGNRYTVQLQFAETFYNGPGQRQFNVSINGNQVLTNFDVYATAGGMNKAVQEQFTAKADAQGRVTIAFSNNAILSGLEVVPPAPPAFPTGAALPLPAAASLGQDGSDFAGLSSTPGPDGFQDVHLELTNLDVNLPITRVVVNRLGGGGLYLSDGSYGSWSDVLVRGASQGGVLASTASLYFQPAGNQTNYPYQIDVYYAGVNAPVSTFVNVTAVARLPLNPTPVAVSLGQDGSDVAQLGPAAGSDGLQDVHLELSNLITSLPIARVEVDRLGGGALYKTDGSYGSWSTVLVRTGGNGSYSSTADVYFQPAQNDVNYPYQINVYYVGQSTPYSTFVRVTANPTLADPQTPVATSLGQDGSDFAQLEPTPGGDGYQDVHIRITGLSPTATIDRIAVSRDGGGADYLSNGGYGTWDAVVTRPANASAVDASIADLYFQPAQDNTNQLFWLDVYENGSSTPIVVPVHVSDVADLKDGSD